MSLPSWWPFWGLGWLFLPRLTIGIIIGTVTGHIGLAWCLGLIGFLIDVSQGD